MGENWVNEAPPEFALIGRFCRGLGVAHDDTRVAVGDDAAVIAVPQGMELAVSVDSMVEGIHFLPDTDPGDLAYKLLAVNLSDMAAMGAQAKWATVALTLPAIDSDWLAGFSTSLDRAARRFGVQVVGGDTTQGQLNLSMNIMGLLDKSDVITRSGARLGDEVYVSGTLGDAALALAWLTEQLDNLKIAAERQQRLLDALHRPRPQVELGVGLRSLASACIDVSDGLVADLSHIAESSEVTIDVNVEAVPLSETYSAADVGYRLALAGGDDYQLAFTAPRQHGQAVSDLAYELGINITKIGDVVAQHRDAVRLWRRGERFKLAGNSGFQHFREP